MAGIIFLTVFLAHKTRSDYFGALIQNLRNTQSTLLQEPKKSQTRNYSIATTNNPASLKTSPLSIE